MPAAPATKKKFVIRKKLSLEFLGEEWKECSITFSPLNMPDMRLVNNLGGAKNDEEAMKEMEGVLKLLTSHFIEGTGFTENGVEPLEASDIEIIGVELINKSLAFLIRSAKPDSTIA